IAGCVVWPEAQDGLLVLDRNANGAVDGGSELFSNALVAAGARGLNALRWIDANGDDRITADDPVFAQLRVWQDANVFADADNRPASKNFCSSNDHYVRLAA